MAKQSDSNQNSNLKRDSNNNKHHKAPDRITNKPSQAENSSQSTSQKLKSGHSQQSSDHSRDITRTKSDSSQLRSKGKSVSMSQGLNLIMNSSGELNSQNLSMGQPKFTGSLKDLLGVDKEIVPIDTLKLQSAVSTNTLPGNWKFQGQNRPESSLRLFGKPSLFQLLQNYNLYAVRLKIPENFVVMDNLKMIECEVVLPSPWIHGKDLSTAISPKGSIPKLGGPNSAFKPVVGGNVSAIKSVSMVTIMDFSQEMLQLLESGHLQKGDLIIEVNEKLLMGEDLPSLVNVIQGCQGELLLTVARDKARENLQDPEFPTDEDFRKMQQKITQLMNELQKKDRTLKQLNELFPWKQTMTKGGNCEQDGYLCSLSDDEYIV